MNTPDKTIAIGVYEDRRHAKLAVEKLLAAGFSQDQIGYVLPHDQPLVEAPKLEHGTKTDEGAFAGAATGSAIGGLIGAAMATAIIPGVGPVIAGGLLVGAAGGAVAGLAGGGILGALIGLSVPEEEAKSYEKEFHSGRTLVSVKAEGRYDEAMGILQAALEAPEHVELHPGARAARATHVSGSSPGSGSVFVE